jgi:hypothetical protein
MQKVVGCPPGATAAAAAAAAHQFIIAKSLADFAEQ